MVLPHYILPAAVGFGGALLLVAALGALAAWRHRRRRRGAWKLLAVRNEMTAEHHLPGQLPVPVEQEDRVAAGEFTFDEAIGWMRQFVAIRRRHPLLGEYRRTICKAELYQQLSERMDRGHWGEVDEIARRLAELDPLDPSAALARGRAMRQMGQFAAAIGFYEQALKLQPTHSLALPELAATCREAGQPHRFEEALDAARKRLGEAHPLTIESRVQLGELVRVFADPVDPATVAHVPRQQYLRNAQARLEEMEPDPGAVIPLGRSMLADDLPELAEALLEQCEQTFGRRLESCVLRGMLRRQQRKLSAAEKSLRQAVELAEHAADARESLLAARDARVELGAVLLERACRERRRDDRRKLTHEAQQHLRLAIDHDPDCTEAIWRLAQPAREEGLDALVGLLEPLTRAYPQAWGPWKLLGDAYAAEGKAVDAQRAYERGLSRRKSDELLLAYIDLLGEGSQVQPLCRVLDDLKDLPSRDPMLRWRAAQTYFQARRLADARKVLQGLVSDEEAAPALRQRARDVLQHLEIADHPRPGG